MTSWTGVHQLLHGRQQTPIFDKFWKYYYDYTVHWAACVSSVSATFLTIIFWRSHSLPNHAIYFIISEFIYYKIMVYYYRFKIVTTLVFFHSIVSICWCKLPLRMIFASHKPSLDMVPLHAVALNVSCMPSFRHVFIWHARCRPWGCSHLDMDPDSPWGCSHLDLGRGRPEDVLTLTWAAIGPEDSFSPVAWGPLQLTRRGVSVAIRRAQRSPAHRSYRTSTN